MKKLIILALTFLLNKIKGKSLPNGNTYYWGIGTYFIIVLLAVIMAGCRNVPTSYEISYNNKVCVIDECEYIKNPTYGINYVYTHKGNCKYCAARRKIELRELIKQLKEK